MCYNPLVYTMIDGIGNAAMEHPTSEELCSRLPQPFQSKSSCIHSVYSRISEILVETADDLIICF